MPLKAFLELSGSVPVVPVVEADFNRWAFLRQQFAVLVS